MDREEKKKWIQKILEEKGVNWAIAALVDASLGYYVPESAEIAIRNFLRGHDTDYCERCLACYGGDLVKMLHHDFDYFLEAERINPERVQRVIEYVKQLKEADFVTQETAGLMYPTLGL